MAAESTELLLPSPHPEPADFLCIAKDHDLAEGLDVTVFSPLDNSAESATIFVGGILRTAAEREGMPSVPTFFGAVASRIAAHVENPSVGIVFNWPGQGLSAGDALDTSIDSRAELLADMAARVQEKYSVEKINFLGCCMGAYSSMVALDSLTADDVGRLMFLSPPAFPEQSHGLAYKDGAFSEAISQDWQLDQSPAWRMVRDIRHPSLFTYFERDDPPIPQAIQDAYEAEAANSEHIELRTITNAGHNFRRLDRPYEAKVTNLEVVETTAQEAADFLTPA